MQTIKIIASAAALAVPLLSQTYVVAPDNAAIVQPGTTATGWRDATTGFRSQFVYDASHFSSQGVHGACAITRLRFRAANGQTTVGGSYPGDGVTTGVTIDIGTCQSDYTAASTLFGANRRAMQNVMTLGTVAIATAAGQSPNNYVIDINIPGGFVYDPDAGFDLLIDITGPDFVGTMPTLAGQTAFLTSRCSAITTATPASSTGTLSATAPVVLFDLFGTGGIRDDGTGNPILVQSSTSVYGSGCGPTTTRAVAEQFAGIPGSQLDLGQGITFVPDVPGAPTRYTIQSGVSAYRARGTTPLTNSTNTGVLGDDQVSGPLSLPFSFPYVGGTTSIVHADSNGYIVLQQTNINGGDSQPSLTRFASGTIAHSGLPRLFPCWFDFNAARNLTTNPGSGVYFDTDAATGRAWITYENIGEFAINTPGVKLYNFQVELAADGTIEFRYGSMSPFGASTIKIIGFTPGASSPVPTSVDLSAAMPLPTGNVDQRPLALAATNPRIGSTCTLTTTWVPSPGIMLQWISPTQLPTGVDLASLGITGGCSAYVDVTGAILESLAFGLGTVPIALAVPDQTALLNVQVYAQSACLSSFNSFGAETSNGVRLTLGSVF